MCTLQWLIHDLNNQQTKLNFKQKRHWFDRLTIPRHVHRWTDTDNIWCKEIVARYKYVIHELSKPTTNLNFKKNQCLINYLHLASVRTKNFNFILTEQTQTWRLATDGLKLIISDTLKTSTSQPTNFNFKQTEPIKASPATDGFKLTTSVTNNYLHLELFTNQQNKMLTANRTSTDFTANGWDLSSQLTKLDKRQT